MPVAPHAAPPTTSSRTHARPPAMRSEKSDVAAMRPSLAFSSSTQSQASRPAPPCPCGGGCPRCTHVDLHTLRGNAPGERLPADTRRRFEDRFGQSLGDVRIHRDRSQAARVGARAVTIGREITFAPGQYRPGDSSGQALLGHELAHTVQQRLAAVPSRQPVRVTEPGHPHEKAAQAAALGDQRAPLSAVAPEAARQIITEDPWTTEERVRSVSRMSLGIVREPILKALRRHDAAGYLAQLRTLAPVDRELLLEDEEFQRVTQAELAGQPRILWYTRSILAFGPAAPDYVREFERAVIARDSAEVIRLLREHGRLRDSHPSPGVQEWIEAEFRGHPEAETLSRTIRHFFLHYEADALPAQREIEIAVLSHQTDRVLRLLRAYPELTDPARSPGLAEWIEVEYHGRSDADRVVAEARLQETTRVTRPAYQLDEAHYERHGGTEAIEHQRNNVTYDLARAPGQLRVIVRIRLRPRPSAAALSGSVSVMSEFWATTIEMVWNNRFRLTNGRGAPLELIFVPLFTDANPHHIVDVHPGGRRSDANNWHEEDDGLTAAHEFGHLIGASDEYELPATAAEIPADVRRRLTPMERRHSTWSGVSPGAGPEDASDRTTHTIMGDQTPIAEYRHVEAITTWFNDHLLSPDEPRYLVNTHAYPDGDRSAH
jgi:hypothetical protein